MGIGIIGAGAIGTAPARAPGHLVDPVNSRGPGTIDPAVLAFGARPVTAGAAVRDQDAVILSVPFARVPDLAGPFAPVPDGTVAIDTSACFPQLGVRADAVDQGQVESLRAAERLGRPGVKPWNAALAGTPRARGGPAGPPGRPALPADSDPARRPGTRLVDGTGPPPPTPASSPTPGAGSR